MNDVTHDDASEDFPQGNNAGSAEQMKKAKKVFFIEIKAYRMHMSRKSGQSWWKIGDRAVWRQSTMDL